MKNTMHVKKWIVLGIFVAAGGLWVAFSNAAEKSREYEIAVEPYKSDTVRMIEAYERLSSQYLTLVQQNLAQMAAADRDILTKLSSIDKKLDDLSVRLARLEMPQSATPPVAPKEQ